MIIVVHKSIVRIFVEKIVYNDRIIPIKLQAQPISILMMQLYMPTSEHADDEVEGLFDIIEEILEEDGKGDTKTPSEWGTGRVLLEMNHIGTLLNHMA